MPLKSNESPIPGGELIEIPGRDPELPNWYKVPTHPLVPDSLEREIWVRFQDLSQAQSEATYEWTQTLPDPYGPDEDMPAKGLLKVDTDKICFSRELGCSDPTKDFVVFLGLDGCDYDPELLCCVNTAIDRLHGSEEDRKKSGRLALENTWRANRVQGGRSYGLGLSLQGPPSRVTVNGGDKFHGTEDEDLITRQKVLEASVAAGMATLKNGPTEILERLDTQADLRNFFPVGTADNKAFATVQINVDHVHARSSRSGINDVSVRFAKAHNDKRDNSGGGTVITNMTRLPKNYQGGRMHFMEHGLYMCHDRLKSFYMSGHGRHVGTPALAPAGMKQNEIPKWYARAIVIAYSAKRVLDGNQVVWPLCRLPNGSPIEWTPEMSNINLNPISHGEDPVSDILTMAKEGPHVAGDDRAFCQWYAQVLQELNLYMWSGVSKDYKPRIDPEKSLPATSVEIDGERVFLQPWNLGPDRLGEEPSSRTTARQEAASTWKEFCDSRARFHPVLGRNIDDEDDVPKKAVPNGRKKRAGGRSVGGSKKTRKDSFKVDHPVAAQSASSTSLKRLLCKRASDKVGKTKNSSATPRNARSRKSEVSKNRRSGRLDKLAQSAAKKPQHPKRKGAAQEPMQVDEPAADRNDDLALLRQEAHLFLKPTESELAVLPTRAPTAEQAMFDDSESSDEDYSPPSTDSSSSEFEGSDMDVDLSSDEVPDGDVPTSFYSRSGRTQRSQGLTIVCALNADSISEAISDFSRGCYLLQNNPQIVRMRSGDVLKQLDAMHDVMRRDPFSNSTALAMAGMFGLLNTLQGHSNVSAVEIRIQHRTIMLSHWAAYSWVMTLFSHAADTCDDDEMDLFWGTRLIRRVTTAVMGMIRNGAQVELDPESYIPGLHAPIYTFTPSDWCPDSRQQFVGEDQAKPFATSVVFDIIRSWMGYPRDDLSFTRYCFCDIILNTSRLESAIFLLDCVWKAYSYPRAYILQNRKQRSETVTTDTFRTLADALSKLPMTKAESYEYRLLQELESVSNKWQVLMRQAIHPPRYSHQAIADIPSEGPSTAISPTLDNSESMEEFLQFYRDLIPLTDDSFQPITALQRNVDANRDFYLPFKMHQPSLLALQRSGGLSANGRLKTRGGLFSLVIFRAVTFGAPAGRYGNGYYPTLHDWQRFKKLHEQKGPKWLCNPRAYGPMIKDRTADHAATYWESSKGLLKKIQEPQTTFKMLCQYLSGQDFPGIGELIAFLLCGDLAHLGVLPMPTADTVGEAIQRVNKGGVQGLRDLGLVPKKGKGRKGDLSGICSAFTQLCNYMDEHLTQQEKEKTAFSPLVVENSLCKYCRCSAWR